MYVYSLCMKYCPTWQPLDIIIMWNHLYCTWGIWFVRRTYIQMNLINSGLFILRRSDNYGLEFSAIYTSSKFSCMRADVKQRFQSFNHPCLVVISISMWRCIHSYTWYNMSVKHNLQIPQKKYIQSQNETKCWRYTIVGRVFPWQESTPYRKLTIEKSHNWTCYREIS